MRKYLATLIIALVGAVLFAGTAFASPDEVLVHEQFGVGSWATWQHENGNWDRGTPGEAKTTGGHEYTLPANKLKSYTLTRVEVKTGYDFDPAVFEKAGGWRNITAYDDFAGEILRYAPDNLSVANNHDLATGKVDVMWSLKLSPTLLQHFRQARNTVDVNTRAELKQLGFHLEKEDSYNKARKGWLWCLPVHIEWYGIPQAPVNCIASSINAGVSGEAEPNQKYTGSITFKYFGPGPVQNVPVGAFNRQYQAVLKDAAGNIVTSTDFAPGEKKDFYFDWTAPASGSTTLTGVINVEPLPDRFAETTKADNKISATVNVEEPIVQQPQGSGNLVFHAKSRKGESRAVNTAKWTDTVTATLTPDTPRPPRGSLTSWKVDWAKLTYPKAHPDFVLGHPQEPVGTRTVNMSSGGHKSTVQFVQDWSVNGAPIFDKITGQRVPGPKNYPVRVEYRVSYNYKWKVRKTDGHGHSYTVTRTGSDSYSKTINAQLLVNGTGTIGVGS